MNRHVKCHCNAGYETESTKVSASDLHEDASGVALLERSRDPPADDALVIAAVQVTARLIQSYPYVHIELGAGLTAALKQGLGEQLNLP